MTRARWFAAALGLGLVGAVAVFSSRKRSTGLLAGIRDQVPSGVLKVIDSELDDAESRARKAGAHGELTFIGAGMTGIVFCDDAGKAFKVSRHNLRLDRDGSEQESGTIAEEASWLQKAGKIPGVKNHVARDVRYDRKNHVLVRECVKPDEKRGSRRNERKLFDLHQRIRNEMKVYGWTAPEFKADSYVYTRDRGPVLVDAGFANRRGHALVQDVLDVLNNRRPLNHHERLSAMAFDLRIERGDSIPVDVANRLLRRLKERDPSIEID